MEYLCRPALTDYSLGALFPAVTVSNDRCIHTRSLVTVTGTSCERGLSGKGVTSLLCSVISTKTLFFPYDLKN